jgi:hypothetical protein
MELLDGRAWVGFLCVLKKEGLLILMARPDGSGRIHSLQGAFIKPWLA